jgi:hypothetical protein
MLLSGVLQFGQLLQFVALLYVKYGRFTAQQLENFKEDPKSTKSYKFTE